MLLFVFAAEKIRKKAEKAENAEKKSTFFPGLFAGWTLAYKKIKL